MELCVWYAVDEGDEVPLKECAVFRFRLLKNPEGHLDEEYFDEVVEQKDIRTNEISGRVSLLQ